ncbi:NDP-hexose 2,3-dehydratase family protein [Temperatibacter marinus]|uniref:NDP-hexose 2,3-dehydratase family protein n=1 Tax=Temperatibacter marinus TaxID=1456591 RepID=A0AA52EKA4_9PROT|nr:NDP-hexose 2,3-dehydratase family protein [Temperatibacter marinus]WND04092.1 NDP-hexose 2,3-dehydratase family protein [Temperatibacter marinus]
MIKTTQELSHYLAMTTEKSGYSLARSRLNVVDDWAYRDRVLKHNTGGFFNVCGMKTSEEKEYLVLFQPQSALTGLVFCRVEDEILILLQARVEPGNIHIGQYGPTIQSTMANYMQLHGGRPTSYLDYFFGFTPSCTVHSTSLQLDLGKRYFQKSKHHMLLEVEDMFPVKSPMAWVSLSALSESMEADYFLNTDLRSLLALYDWQKYQSGKTEVIDNYGSEGALSDLITHHLMQQKTTLSSHRLVSLDGLEGWSRSEEGVVSNDKRAPYIHFYRSQCQSREKDSWIQPLMGVAGVGLVQLYMRTGAHQPEYLIVSGKEFGVSEEAVLHPSRLYYAEEMVDFFDPDEEFLDKMKPYGGEGKRVLRAFYQSDEGGRFYQMRSLYQLIEVDETYQKASNEFWISRAELKKLLLTNNMNSIQLRCIATLLD